MTTPADGARRRWSGADVIAALQAWARAHGRPPSTEDWRTSGGSAYPSAPIVYKHFGSWHRALDAAQLEHPARGPRPTWSPEAVIELLRADARHRGRAPTEAEWRNVAGPDAATIRRIFGSWSAAASAAGLTPNAPGSTARWSAERIIALLQHDARRDGHPPTPAAWAAARDRPQPRTVARYCGSWSAALSHAGLAPSARRRAPSARRRAWTPALVLDTLHVDHARLARLPTVSEWNGDPRRPTQSTVVYHFGSWRDMVLAAGLTPRSSGVRVVGDRAATQGWNREAVVIALRAWAREHGRSPRRRDWLCSGPAHPEGGVVYRLFGSWPAALIAAELDTPPAGPPQRPSGWDPDAIIDAIVQWTERFGEPPATVDWNPALARTRAEHHRADLFDAERPRWPVQSAVTHHFGSWNAALSAARQPTTATGLKRQSPRALAADAGVHTAAWTREEVLHAIRAHRARHAHNPTYDSWRAADPSGARPSTRTVLRLFGSWSEALRTAQAADLTLPLAPR